MNLNFSRGMITNPGDHMPRNREVTAQWLMDCRSDEQGWLIPRKGRTKLSDETNLTAVFAHKGFIFAIVNHNELKWGNINDFNLQSFPVPRTFTVNAFIRGYANFVPVGNKIFLIGVGNPVVIDISEDIPTVQAFRLPQTPIIGTVNIDHVGDEDGYEVGIRAQMMILDDEGNRVVVAPVSDVMERFYVRIEGDNRPDKTQITITLGDILVPLGPITHIEYYITRSPNTPEETTDLVSLGRIPYSVGQTVNAAYSDELESEISNYADVGEEVTPQYLVTDNIRTYAAEHESQRLYFSYYDAITHERLYQNFTDFDNVELQGGDITGLEILNETRLVVFATNQIQMYSLDPSPSLIQVMQIIAPGPDRGKTIGCTSPQSIVNMGSQLYFLATNNYVYRLDERGLTPMSDRVLGLFQTVRKRTASSDGRLLLNHVVAFARGENYIISVPITDDEPNRTIEHDLITGAWWQDSFGIYAVSKSESERIFGIVGGELHALYEGDTDNGTAIRRIWKNNPYLQHTHSHWDWVSIYGLDPMEVDVVCNTESGRVEGRITPSMPGAWFESRMGVNLRGRFYVVELSTESLATIDRITVNERISPR